MVAINWIGTLALPCYSVVGFNMMRSQIVSVCSPLFSTTSWTTSVLLIYKDTGRRDQPLFFSDQEATCSKNICDWGFGKEVVCQGASFLYKIVPGRPTCNVLCKKEVGWRGGETWRTWKRTLNCRCDYIVEQWLDCTINKYQGSKEQVRHNSRKWVKIGHIFKGWCVVI